MPNISWYFILLIPIAYWLKNDNHKMFMVVSILGFALFILCSTSYVPKKLINTIEKTYIPIRLNQLDNTKTYYIYVLGAGASIDADIPATMNLNATALTRLVEGIRIYNSLNHTVLVTSAALENGIKSQAKLSKEAAISLGVKEQNIKMLETPTSTFEEAKAFKKRFGTNKNIILVTSAMHMPRAVEIFLDQGIKVIPAPTDYINNKDSFIYNGLTIPSFQSLNLLNNYQIAIVKHLYYKWFKKPQQ
jgi:uncharacterized SAM-binding protein YcdF (DUF218 family)